LHDGVLLDCKGQHPCTDALPFPALLGWFAAKSKPVIEPPGSRPDHPLQRNAAGAPSRTPLHPGCRPQRPLNRLFACFAGAPAAENPVHRLLIATKGRQQLSSLSPSV
jgi:hypothetical protein